MKTVGILGGMGPKATVYFQELLLDNDNVETDQEHLNMIVSCHSTIPDRTKFLLGNNEDNPIPYLIDDAKMLEKCGCGLLVLTCNTSHFAYDEISKNISVPLINMPYEVSYIINNNPKIKKVGLMATLGTIKAKIYDRYLEKELFYADEDLNNEVMDLIYNKVKKGIKVSKRDFYRVLDKYFDNGCDIVIMGCTELSVIVRDNDLYSDNRIIDSMDVLAKKTVELAKKI